MEAWYEHFFVIDWSDFWRWGAGVGAGEGLEVVTMVGGLLGLGVTNHL